MTETTHTGRPRIAEFLVATFAISWGCWAFVLIRGGDHLSGISLPFFVLASFGPLLAACFLRVVHGRASAKRRRSWHLRHLAPALALGAVGTVAAFAGGAVTGQRTFDAHDASEALTSFGNPVVFLAVYLIMGPLSEEPGWRGYLLPKLRLRLTPLKVGLFFGPLWALWHLPLFLIPGTYQYDQGIWSVGGAMFLISTMGLTVAISFAFEKLGGLPAGIIVHYASNTLPAVLGLTTQANVVWDAAGKVLLAAVLLRFFWREPATPSERTDAPALASSPRTRPGDRPAAPRIR
jgi:membrane protease YdiL (CAAX protease family)